MPRAVPAAFAALAILVQVLWPLLAQAKPDSTMRVAICNAAAPGLEVAIPGPDSPAEKSWASHAGHCGLCSAGAVLPASPQGSPSSNACSADAPLVSRSAAAGLGAPPYPPQSARAPPA